jgi:hypothetical protein
MQKEFRSKAKFVGKTQKLPATTVDINIIMISQTD